MLAQTRSPWLRRMAAMLLLLAALGSAVIPAYADDEEPQIQPMPLYMAIDHFGKISLTSGQKDQPRQATRLKAPAAPVVLSTLGQNLVVVRFDNYDLVFDLGKRRAGVITFDRGYYKVTRLAQAGNALLIEAGRTFVRNDAPNAGLDNQANAKVKVGRRSCMETAFHSRMDGIVLNAVRLRKEPYIPMELDSNWIGSLRSREKVFILQTYCNAGSWLRLVGEAGIIGWAKEWGLTEELVERTFIAPDTLKK